MRLKNNKKLYLYTHVYMYVFITIILFILDSSLFINQVLAIILYNRICKLIYTCKCFVLLTMFTV